MSNIDDAIQIKVFFTNFRDRCNRFPGPIVFSRGHQTEMSFGKVLLAEFGYSTKHRNSAIVLDTFAQLLLVPGVGNAIENYALNHNIRIKLRAACDDSRHRAGDFCTIHT